MAYLENSSNLTLTSYDEDSFVNTANADSANYSLRYPSVKGDPVGILVASGSLTPLQATGTGIHSPKEYSYCFYYFVGISV